MASGAGTAAEAALPVVKTEPGLPSVADRILAICGEIPDGVSDKILKVSSEWILWLELWLTTQLKTLMIL